MNYRDAGVECHALDLSAEETNFFFEPFDINDICMPSHLHHRGHRYIREFAYEWLMANVSSEIERRTNTPTSWHHAGTSNVRIFMFQHKHHAMMFKLAWEGRCNGL